MKLLLGARGMLGTALEQVLKGSGEMAAWDVGDLDITQRDQVLAKVGAMRPAVIINAAGYAKVDDAESNAEEAFAVNEAGVRNLAEAAKDVGATLVHYSTDYVFDGTKQAGYAEDDVAGPAVNTYGASKLAGEQVLREINPRYFLIRTAWLYGPKGKNFVDTMLPLADSRDTIDVVNDQHGSPTYTNDLAAATQELLTGSYEPTVYHLTNDGITTWYEFAREIFRQAGINVNVQPIPSRDYPTPATRPEYSILKNTRGPRLRPWQDALAEYLQAR